MAIPANTVGIGRVAVTGLSAQVWMDKDGAINLERLFAGFTQEEDAGAADQEAVSTAPTDTNPPQAASSAENDWTVKLAAVELENASIELEDRSITPAAKFELAPVQVKIDGPHPGPDTTGASDLERNARWHDVHQGRRHAHTRAIRRRARRAARRAGPAQVPTVRRPGNSHDHTSRPGPGHGQVLDLASVGQEARACLRRRRARHRFPLDRTTRSSDDFVNFERLDLRKLRFAMEPDSLSIDRVDAAKTLCARQHQPGPGAECRGGIRPGGHGGGAGRTQGKGRRGGVRRKRAKEAPAAARAQEGAEKEPAPPPPREVLVETGWPIRIREVRIESGQMNFSDQFIQPNFAADIKDLERHADRAVDRSQLLGQGGSQGRGRGILAGHDRRRDTALRLRPAHRHRDEVREHPAAHLQPLFGAVRRLQHRQGLAHDGPPVPDRGSQARSKASHPHRPARMGRGDREQGSRAAAGQARDLVAQGRRRRDRSRTYRSTARWTTRSSGLDRSSGRSSRTSWSRL